MTIEAIKAVVDLIEMGGVVGQEDIVKCLRSAIEQAERQEHSIEVRTFDTTVTFVTREPLSQYKDGDRFYRAPPQRQPSGSFVAWNNTLCNPLAPAEKQNLSAWEDGYASGIKDQRQPLTEEEIDALVPSPVPVVAVRYLQTFARAIERAHGIGGGE